MSSADGHPDAVTNTEERHALGLSHSESGCLICQRDESSRMVNAQAAAAVKAQQRIDVLEARAVIDNDTLRALTQQVADLNAQLAAVEREHAITTNGAIDAIGVRDKRIGEQSRLLDRCAEVAEHALMNVRSITGGDEKRLRDLLTALREDDARGLLLDENVELRADNERLEAERDAATRRAEAAEAAHALAMENLDALHAERETMRAEKGQLAAQLREMTTQVERAAALLDSVRLERTALACARDVGLARVAMMRDLLVEAEDGHSMTCDVNHNTPDNMSGCNCGWAQRRETALAASAVESDAFVAGVRRPILGALAEVLPWARAWVQHGEKQYGPNHDMRHAIDVAQSLLAPAPTKTLGDALGHNRPDGTPCNYIAATHCLKCGWSRARDAAFWCSKCGQDRVASLDAVCPSCVAPTKTGAAK